MSVSVIRYYGKQNRNICGYCKGNRSSYSHGMHAYMMTTQDYQDLINRGWRRSGQYCYKPNNFKTCCPCYTIKCDSEKFKLSKSHKKVLRRMNKFLKDGLKEKNENNAQTEHVDIDLPREIVHIPNVSDEPFTPDDMININNEINSCDIAVKRSFKCSNIDNKPKEIKISTETDKGILENDYNNVCNIVSSNTHEREQKLCKKAKEKRIERKKAKLEEQGLSLDSLQKKYKNEEKTLSDYINETSENDCHKLEIVLVPSSKASIPQALNLYQKYQVTIHKDPLDSIRKIDFEKFLVKSPLKNCKPEHGPSSGYGSFHQHYWLDDKLIAVGVIDVLPCSVSSVYFFYDPDYSFLSLGTYGSLREIDFVRQLSETTPALKHYYMGFYIHSCPKMKYKGKLFPSYLLCPEKYTWHLLTDEIRAKLDEKKYQVLNDDPNYKDEEEFTKDVLNETLILNNRNSYTTYLEFKQITNRNIDDEILEYGTLIGKSCARRICFTYF